MEKAILSFRLCKYVISLTSERKRNTKLSKRDEVRSYDCWKIDLLCGFRKKEKKTFLYGVVKFLGLAITYPYHYKLLGLIFKKNHISRFISTDFDDTYFYFVL